MKIFTKHRKQKEAGEPGHQPQASSESKSSKFKVKRIPLWFKNKALEYWRVLKITKKPTMEEFKATSKASALGLALVGLIGFIITMIAQLTL